MEIDTAFMLFCLYVAELKYKLSCYYLMGKKTWCKATCTAVFHCPMKLMEYLNLLNLNLQVYLTCHTHITKTRLHT